MATGINAAGDIVLFAAAGNSYGGPGSGNLLHAGNLIPITVGAPSGLNGVGDIVGSYVDASYCPQHGLLLHTANFTNFTNVTTVDHPGASRSEERRVGKQRRYRVL